MGYNHTFHWPAGPKEVILTGTFDNWSRTLPLIKTSKGDFEITLPLNKSQLQDDKIIFKFVVDNNWRTSDEFQKTTDEHGIENNVIYLKDLSKESKSNEGVKIPEAGGLAYPTSNSAVTSQESKDVKHTVLPSQEGKQKTLGEPGVVIPQNVNEIKEFNEVRDVDAKELNERLNKTAKEEEEKSKNLTTTVLPSEEGKQKTLGEPGVVIPQNANEIKEFNEVRDVDAKELNERLNKTAKEEEEKSKNLTTTVLPSEEGKQKTLGEPGVVIPQNANEIKEFNEIRDVDAKELNEKLNGTKEKSSTGEAEAYEGKTKVKQVIRRDKQTGEETVIHSEPYVEEEVKTLDPKKNGTTTSAINQSKPKETAAQTAPEPEIKKSVARKSSQTKQPVKEKKGFFKKLFKKIND